MNVKEKERKPNRKRERERERERKTGISSMIGFDTATSSFLNLLINILYRKKMKKAKSKRNSSISQ